MAKVVLQVINDLGEIENEATLARGIELCNAEWLMARIKELADLPSSSVRLVLELHYKDGDVGAYIDHQVAKLWAQFSKSGEPSHILIRPDTKQGQLLSNQLFAAARRSIGSADTAEAKE
jgi:hypothetical protein